MARQCSVDDCDRTDLTRGMCRSHYQRWAYRNLPPRGSEMRVCACGCGAEFDAYLSSSGGRCREPEKHIFATLQCQVRANHKAQTIYSRERVCKLRGCREVFNPYTNYAGGRAVWAGGRVYCSKDHQLQGVAKVLRANARKKKADARS